MRSTQLSSSEIQDLINRYLSEQKKLEFQIEEVKDTVFQLQELKNSVQEREKVAVERLVTKRQKSILKAGKQERTPSSGSTKKRRGRPPKASSGQAKNTSSNAAKVGYKLSVWDYDVLESIQQADKARITQEIIDFVKNKELSRGGKASDEEVRLKVTRSLQKLANRRNDLVKVSFKGKGFAYAMPKWVNQRGTIDKSHKHS